MVLGFWRKRREALDPLSVFDALIEDLERQAGEVRRAAATLLALKLDLGRSIGRYEARRGELDSRRALAVARGDAVGERVLAEDLRQAEEALEASRASQRRAEEDGAVLLEAARTAEERLRALRLERDAAAARRTVDTLVTEALRATVERFDAVLALDAARDELERAHALAAVYREERQR